jgi:hypothetical protein
VIRTTLTTASGRFEGFRCGFLSKKGSNINKIIPTIGAKTYGRITKEGSKTLRWILIEVPLKAKKISPYKEYYQRIARRRERYTVSLARKLLKKIYFMLKEVEKAETNLTQRIGVGRTPSGVMA